MTLCKLCNNLNLASLIDEDGFLEDVPHQKSLGQLQRAAPTCALCKLFLDELSATIQQHNLSASLESIWEDSPLVIRGIKTAAAEEDANNMGRLCGLKLRCDKAYAEAELEPVYFSLYVRGDDDKESKTALDDLIVGRGIGPAEDSGPLVKEWIHECETKHFTCSSPDVPSRLPTRVIDVGTPAGPDPRLVVTKPGETSRYIALSHCWGGKAHVVTCTTKATIEQHREGIPMATLPKTFREAVAITRDLGLRYLWIDSLCIVQDDARDWELESARMGAVYSSAYVTIAAAASKDASGGCFLPRDASSHVKVKYRLGKKKFADVYVRPRPRGLKELGNCHLQSRAWVTQERVLSRRLIHYDADQVLWECCEMRKSEDAVPADTYISSQAKSWGGQVNYEDAELFVWDWHMMVEDYTRRNLTVGDDKFPALSGMAAVVEERTGRGYVAGLWREYLVPGILWRRALHSWLVPPSPNKSGSGYRAPSWSWASLEGEVEMPTQYEQPDIDTQDDRENPLDCVLKDLEAETSPIGLDPRGRLASGVLKLVGPLKQVDARTDPQTPGYETPYLAIPGYIDHLRCRGEVVGQAVFDREYAHPARDTDADEALYFMLVTIRRATRHLWAGLLLESTGRDGEWRRVGYAFQPQSTRLWQEDGWFFDDAVEERITII